MLSQEVGSLMHRTHTNPDTKGNIQAGKREQGHKDGEREEERGKKSGGRTCRARPRKSPRDLRAQRSALPPPFWVLVLALPVSPQWLWDARPHLQPGLGGINVLPGLSMNSPADRQPTRDGRGDTPSCLRRESQAGAEAPPQTRQQPTEWRAWQAPQNAYTCVHMRACHRVKRETAVMCGLGGEATAATQHLTVWPDMETGSRQTELLSFRCGHTGAGPPEKSDMGRKRIAGRTPFGFSSCKPSTSRQPANHRSPGRGKEGFCYRVRREQGAAETPTLDFQPPKPRDNTLLLLAATWSVTLTQDPGN